MHKAEKDATMTACPATFWYRNEVGNTSELAQL